MKGKINCPGELSEGEKPEPEFRNVPHTAKRPRRDLPPGRFSGSKKIGDFRRSEIPEFLHILFFDPAFRGAGPDADPVESGFNDPHLFAGLQIDVGQTERLS